MDQREIVSLLKKHYFWGLNVLIVLVALACWWLATSAVNKQYVARKAEIDKHVAAMKKLSGAQNPANERVVKAIEEDKIAEIKKNVAEAWDTLYKDQQKNNRFPDILGKDFQAAFEKRGDDGKLSDIDDALRQSFGNRLKEYWKDPFTRIGIPFPEKDASPAKVDPTRRQPAEAQGIVDWDTGDVERFLTRFNWAGIPNTSQVRLAMEDLWVYEALLRVIERTNGKARTRFEAAVKRIEGLDIGPEFFAPVKRTGAPAPGRRPEGLLGPTVEGPMGRGGLPPGAGRAPPATPQATPETAPTTAEGGAPENRYVNAKFEGLKSGDAAPYAEFKMMPVRMRLVIDQRKLAKLLVECANSSMPIEVRKVSILPRGEAPANKQSGRPSGAGVSAATPAHEMALELEGTIYIFNPPQVKAEGDAAADKKPDAEAPGDAVKDKAAKTEADKTEADKTETDKTEATKTEADAKTEAATKTEAADGDPIAPKPKP